jgi:hypothetical protein
MMSNLPSYAAVKGEPSRLSQEFFSAVSFDTGHRPRYERLRTLFIDEGLLIKNSGSAPVISSVDQFFAPRLPMVDTNELAFFRQAELSEITEIFGNMAHRFSTDEKPGRMNGVTFSARGMISNQFILTPASWKISALAWGDERPGLPLRRKAWPCMLCGQ